MRGQVRETGVHTDFSGMARPRLLESGKKPLVGRHSGLWALDKVGSALQSLVQLSVQQKRVEVPQAIPVTAGFEKYLT